MDVVMGWLSKIDWAAISAAVISFVIGLGIIKPKLNKAMEILGDVAVLLADIKKGSEDGKYTAEEIKQIAADGEHLIAEFKK